MANSYKTEDEILYAAEVENLWLGTKGWGVLDGLAVTESSPAAMSVTVGTGSAILNAGWVSVGVASTLAISNGDGTNDRIDIVTLDTSGDLTVTEGTPAADALPPALPANSILLERVLVAAGESTSIVNADMTDQRVYPSPSWNADLSATVLVNDTTSDSAWSDVDVSGVTGGGRRLVTVKVKNTAGGGLALCHLRRKGDADDFVVDSSNALGINSCALAADGDCAYLQVMTNVNGIFEFQTTGNAITMTLEGYV